MKGFKGFWDIYLDDGILDLWSTTSYMLTLSGMNMST